MSLQAVVPFSINGQNFYTHSSWFSQKQYNGWSSIPKQNCNLAFYYALSTVSLVGILFRKAPFVKSVFSSSGKLLMGAGGAFVGSYIGWLGLLKTQQSSQFTRLVGRNDCGSTPLWRKQSQVVNLREQDYKTFMGRRQGTVYTSGDVKSYKPDCVLLPNNSVEKLV